jgi:ATP-dependent Clp protease protease subunit
VEEGMAIKQMLTKIIADRAGKSYEFMHDNMERDKWLSPEMALEFGIIDKIIMPHDHPATNDNVNDLTKAKKSDKKGKK